MKYFVCRKGVGHKLGSVFSSMDEEEVVSGIVTI